MHFVPSVDSQRRHDPLDIYPALFNQMVPEEHRAFAIDNLLITATLVDKIILARLHAIIEQLLSAYKAV